MVLNPSRYSPSQPTRFAHCMAEILVRLRDYGSLLVDSLESMRNEYVVALLHSALHIVRDDTQKQFSMRPQYEVTGKKVQAESIRHQSIY